MINMDMNDDQAQLLARLRNLGFAFDRQFTARRPVRPVSSTKRLVELPLKEYFFKLGNETMSFDQVWDKVCQLYSSTALRNGGTVITKSSDTPVYEAISDKQLESEVSRYSVDTLDYLIGHNHEMLDDILKSESGNMKDAWLNLFVFLYQTSVKAALIPDRSKAVDYLGQIRTKGMLHTQNDPEGLALREDFTFPYYTPLKAAQIDVAYFKKALQSHNSTSAITEKIGTDAEAF